MKKTIFFTLFYTFFSSAKFDEIFVYIMPLSAKKNFYACILSKVTGTQNRNKNISFTALQSCMKKIKETPMTSSEEMSHECLPLDSKREKMIIPNIDTPNGGEIYGILEKCSHAIRNKKMPSYFHLDLDCKEIIPKKPVILNKENNDTVK